MLASQALPLSFTTSLYPGTFKVFILRNPNAVHPKYSPYSTGKTLCHVYDLIDSIRSILMIYLSLKMSSLELKWFFHQNPFSTITRLNVPRSWWFAQVQGQMEQGFCFCWVSCFRTAMKAGTGRQLTASLFLLVQSGAFWRGTFSHKGRLGVLNSWWSMRQ